VTRSRWRHLAWLYPAATAFVVLASANHFIFDVIGGLAIAVLGMAATRMRPVRAAGVLRSSGSVFQAPPSSPDAETQAASTRLALSSAAPGIVRRGGRATCRRCPEGHQDGRPASFTDKKVTDRRWPGILSARAVFGEIFGNEAFRLFCSIAASCEARGGWENGRIAALCLIPARAWRPRSPGTALTRTSTGASSMRCCGNEAF
jgi:PAP2 superfamily